MINDYNNPPNLLMELLFLFIVGMEIETMVRYKLPVIIVIVNNNGIYSGFDKETMADIQSGGDVTQW